MSGEDPRVTAARKVLAEVERARNSTDFEVNAWTYEAIAARHGRLAYALTGLLEYVDEQARKDGE